MIFGYVLRHRTVQEEAAGLLQLAAAAAPELLRLQNSTPDNRQPFRILVEQTDRLGLDEAEVSVRRME